MGNLMTAERSDDQARIAEQHADAIRELLEAMPSVVDLANGPEPMPATTAVLRQQD
jgi:hypothetical protein